jgi:hypothetical protein
MVVAGLDALRNSVHPQLDLRQAGINARRDISAGTGIVAAVGDVDSRRLNSPCTKERIPVARKYVTSPLSFRLACRPIATGSGEINMFQTNLPVWFHRLPVRLVEERLPSSDETGHLGRAAKAGLMLSHACPSSNC